LGTAKKKTKKEIPKLLDKEKKRRVGKDAKEKKRGATLYQINQEATSTGTRLLQFCMPGSEGGEERIRVEETPSRSQRVQANRKKDIPYQGSF